MKFYDNNGGIHNTYIEAMFANINSKMKKHVFSKIKIPGFKEAANIKGTYYNLAEDFYGDDFSMEVNGIYDDSINNDMAIPIQGRDNVFVPGVTPKVECSKKHTIRIDYENYQMILEDENGNVLHVTQIDSRLENCPTKDLINMVYDIVDKPETPKEDTNKG